ncbi:hypothetical protein BU120_13330 [Staphylococcus xylosus]|nr:hypothetical protein BU120_13330 [Staphylococcus xylosus]
MKVFFKIFIIGMIAQLLVILILNLFRFKMWKSFEQAEIVVGIVGLFTTCLGAYLGAKIAGSESRKLFKQQIKMNDLQQNMDANLLVLEKIDIIPKYIDDLNKLLNKSNVFHPKNIEKINSKYNQIRKILMEVKDNELSKTSIVIYSDTMKFIAKVVKVEKIFLLPIPNNETEKLISNTLDEVMPDEFIYSWTSNNINQNNELVVTIRKNKGDFSGEENLIPIEKIVDTNKIYFDDKLKLLKSNLNHLKIAYNTMKYKNTDDLIAEYSKLYKD